MIAALNRDVERLQQQLDSLSHRKDSHFGSLKEMEMLVKEKQKVVNFVAVKHESIIKMSSIIIMPNITPSQKGGTSVDSSDLLAQKKRNIYLAISRQNVVKGGATQIANVQLGYDNGYAELKFKRGLDRYLKK